MKTLQAALRTLRDAARAVRPGPTAQASARKLDAAIASRLKIIGRLYDMNMFQSAARDAIRSECQQWQALRASAEPPEKSRHLEVARTIADRCASLLVNLQYRK